MSADNTNNTDANTITLTAVNADYPDSTVSGTKFVMGGQLTLTPVALKGKAISQADMYAMLGLTDYVAKNPQ